MGRAFEKKFPKPKDKPGMINDNPLMWWCDKQEAWKTALEWVLEDIKTCQDKDMMGYLREDMLTDDIKKELADG